jgi:hypothetical protein
VAQRAGQAKTQDEQLAAAFKLVLGRAPGEAEIAWCREALDKEAAFHAQADRSSTPDEASRRALTRLCHTLLNTSEFLYIP